MCEFGLEGVTVGISKKSSNKDKELKDYNNTNNPDRKDYGLITSFEMNSIVLELYRRTPSP